MKQGYIILKGTEGEGYFLVDGVVYTFYPKAHTVMNEYALTRNGQGRNYKWSVDAKRWTEGNEYVMILIVDIK